MTVAEHRDAILAAGFSEIHKVAAAGTPVMYRATLDTPMPVRFPS